MGAFGVLSYFWVKMELRHSREHAPNKYLIAAGAWSYSLYLVHVQGMVLYARLPIPFLGYLLTWCFTMLCSLGLAYLFYIVVERPSHRLARSIKLDRSARSASATAIAPGSIEEAAP
jgi:peptidoglycan/LPS O-acetylase OafA/YrhL